MTGQSGMIGCVVSCLDDCEFKEELRGQYLDYMKERRIKDMVRVLNKQRKLLMDDLHAVQRQVDKLDFVIRCLEQAEEMKNVECSAPVQNRSGME